VLITINIIIHVNVTKIVKGALNYKILCYVTYCSCLSSGVCCYVLDVLVLFTYNVIISCLIIYMCFCLLECDVVIEFFLFRVSYVLLIMWMFVFELFLFLVSMSTNHDTQQDVNNKR
jgi:hypothetical protein